MKNFFFFVTRYLLVPCHYCVKNPDLLFTSNSSVKDIIGLLPYYILILSNQYFNSIIKVEVNQFNFKRKSLFVSKKLKIYSFILAMMKF